jgi:uncharacterized LabA/DUF88 family protein
MTVEQSASAPTPPGCRPAVALFGDYENIKYSLKNQFGAEPDIPALLQSVAGEGQLLCARWYADWRQPPIRFDVARLHATGGELIFVPGRQENGVRIKNGADVRLAIDCVSLAYQLPAIATVVLVTGDGDLDHLARFLKLHGKRVVVIGCEPTMSGLLANSATRLILYEREVAAGLGMTAQPPPTTAPGARCPEVPDLVLPAAEQRTLPALPAGVRPPDYRP